LGVNLVIQIGQLATLGIAVGRQDFRSSDGGHARKKGAKD